MKIISFFSYKGGAGRSTLAYNIIPILAANHIRPTSESPMIVIDTDVDSCGMSYLLRADNKVTDDNSTQYLFSGSAKGKMAEFFKQLIPVGKAFGYPIDDAILLLPAKDNKNIRKESKCNYDLAIEAIGNLNDFLAFCEDKANVSAVILDSAVGNNATANISNYVSNIIVCCMRPTIQFVNGTRRFFVGIENGEKEIGEDKTVIFVPNVIPKYSTTINGVMYPGYAIDVINDSFESSFGGEHLHNYVLDMLDREEFGIPAVDRFMWQEGQLFSVDKDKLTEDEKLALERYKKLAGIINEID